MELKGRGVFLTGGAQGIGRCMTAALLGKGARVLFCDIKAEVGKTTEEELQKQYGADSVAFVQCDVTNADQLKAAFEAAVTKFGAVEIYVNNAGIFDERVWEKMLAINTTAQIRGSELAFEHMRRDKGGRGGVIANTVSVAAFMRNHWFPTYYASKHAMLGYTTCRACDPAMPAQGVRWCTLCPHLVNTDLLVLEDGQGRDQDNFLQFLQQWQQNFMEPLQVADALIFQLEDVKNNGKILMVTKEGHVYRKRVMVNEDQVSNPTVVDQDLPAHPPPPGPLGQ